MDYKTKALNHVRSVCTEMIKKDVVELRHLLRGMAYKNIHLIGFNEYVLSFGTNGGEGIALIYYLTKDGENQDQSFYKAYCEIVGTN